MKHHTSHKYGFFDEGAPKYRKQLTSEMSQITVQESSISNALREITAAGTNVENYAQKCQDDIEHAFGELMSVLHVCKQAMKDEATTYYSSLVGVFEQQNRKAEGSSGENQISGCLSRYYLTRHRTFLTRMESTFERIMKTYM